MNPPRPLAAGRVDGLSDTLFLQSPATKGRGTLPFPSLLDWARMLVGGSGAVPAPPQAPAVASRLLETLSPQSLILNTEGNPPLHLPAGLGSAACWRVGAPLSLLGTLPGHTD